MMLSQRQPFLDTAAQVVAGQTPMDQLEPPLAALQNQLNAWLDQLDSTPHQPELSEESLRLLDKALARLEGALDQTQADLTAGDADNLPISLQAAEDALGTLHGLEQGFLQAVYRGPTFHPFFNRILLHMGYFFRGGQHTEATLALLGSLEQVLDEVGEPEQTEPVAQACRAFQDWLGSADLEALGEIQVRLLAASDDLARSLAAQAERDLTGHPSLWPAVNLVILAGQGWLAGQVAEGAFLESIELCRGILAREFPESEAAMGQVLERLAENPASFPAEVENLRRAGDALVVASGSQQGTLDLLQNEGLTGASQLPPLLAGLLELAENYLHNPAEADPLAEGLRRLHDLLTRSQACPEPADEQQAESLDLALSQLEAFHQQLAAFHQSRDSSHLEAARQTSQAACNQLQDLSKYQPR